jgi:amino acid adenylation domain-containing protein
MNIVLRNGYVLNQSNTIPVWPRPQKIPLSFAQERLWFIDALEGSLPYHILPFVLRLKGELDRQVLQQALMTIVNRHEVLRTVIAEEDGQPYQHILVKDGWQLGDAGHFVYTDELALAGKIEELTQTPFNLATDYLLRADLIPTGPAEHVLVGTLHHIVSDGLSIPILVRELTALYNCFAAGRPCELPDLPVQYADYALWQRDYLCEEVLQNKLTYWQQQLSWAPVLQLPTDHPREAVRSNKGASAAFRLDPELSGRLETLSLENGATLYMTLLSALTILLYRYSGQDDICVGSPIAGRPMQELEGLIGFFVNTLVLRTRLSPDISFRHLLVQVKKTTLDAYGHQDVPFEKIVDALVTERYLSRNPLFDVTFVLQNNTRPDSLETALSGLSVSVEGNPNNTAQFDLSVTLQQQADGIMGSMTYDSDLYDLATIGRMITHYQRLLRSVVAGQDQPIGELAMITEAERQELLFTFNDTATDYPSNKTIIDLFYQQAAKRPDSIALVFDNEELSYRQLDERSNQIAQLLRSRGVHEDSLVAICMERSLEMIVAILGILKAGGAYVPIDPGYPADRIAYILEDTAAPIALTAGSIQLPVAENREVINIDTEKTLIDTQQITPVATQLHPSHLAYIIYTSGSTGKPKGVEICHSNASAFLHWAVSEFKNVPFEILYATTSYCFDLSVFEFFLPLITGKTIRVLNTVFDIQKFLLQDSCVMINTVPSAVESLIEQNANWPNVVALNMAGEAIPVKLKKKLDYVAIEVRNLYGPSECTTYSTCYRFKEEAHNLIPIGKPIANTQIFILGPHQNLTPIGVTGEICIAGAGLARGYLNRPELTAEKFIPHPFSSNPEDRIYRTGDLGRWLPDGNIEFLGRRDDQVKIRGYRIEPAEIESALVQSGLVRQAIVLCREDNSGNKRLIAYIVPAVGYTAESALTYIRTKLPEYMVPSLLVALGSLPLTPNGKTDRKTLLQLDLSGTAQQTYEAPQGPIEVQLAAIWSDLLRIQRVGRHDNFYQLGGHSLLAMRLIAAIRKELSIGLSIRELVNNPTILESADYIKNNIAKLAFKKMSVENGHILELSSTSKGKTIFFAPTIKGLCVGIEELARELASDFQIYGLQMIGLFENEIPLKTIEEIAAQNIKWMKTIQPNGPYIVVGYSYAGYIAYEMAKQIAKGGEEVALPVIIDTDPDYPDFSKRMEKPLYFFTKEIAENYKMIEKLFPDWSEKLLQELLDIPLEERPSHIKKALQNLFPTRDENIEFVIRLISLETNIYLMKYEVKEKINTAGIIFMASECNEKSVLKWSNYIQSPTFFTIQGDHGNIKDDQGAIEIARIIKEYKITPVTN